MEMVFNLASLSTLNVTSLSMFEISAVTMPLFSLNVKSTSSSVVRSMKL